MTKRFENAISALVSGYFNETLAKDIGTACAVGNIVAKAIDAKITVRKTPMSYLYLSDKRNEAWVMVFSTVFKKQTIDLTSYKGEAKEIIDATGYSVEELAKIEKAFESNTTITFTRYPYLSKNEIMEDQFNGLMAVVDVLCEIEGINEVKKYKEMFQPA